MLTCKITYYITTKHRDFYWFYGFVCYSWMATTVFNIDIINYILVAHRYVNKIKILSQKHELWNVIFKYFILENGPGLKEARYILRLPVYSSASVWVWQFNPLPSATIWIFLIHKHKIYTTPTIYHSHIHRHSDEITTKQTPFLDLNI